jgi:hypothetical protein
MHQENLNKVHKLEAYIDEEIEKVKRSKVSKEDIPDIETGICKRIQFDFIHVRLVLVC